MTTPVPDTATIADALDRFAVFMIRMSSAKRELSLSSASTLSRLARGGPFRLTELADLERITQPSMTTLVGRLEAQGLVERAADPSDGRAVLVSVTKQGRKALRRRTQVRVGSLAELLEDLTLEDRAALAAAIPALERLLDHPTDECQWRSIS